MEIREVKVSVTKSKLGYESLKVYIPKDWSSKLGIDKYDRNLIMQFDGDKIIIKKK